MSSMKPPAFPPAAPQSMQVRVEDVSGISPAPLHFTDTFRIGRASSCEVCIQNDFVSRVHAEVTLGAEGWCIRDKSSANGLYADGVRVASLLLLSPQQIRLGAEGPRLFFDPPRLRPVHSEPISPGSGEETIVAHYKERYLGKIPLNEPVGERTFFIRRALAEVHTTQKKAQGRRTLAFTCVIAALLCAVLFGLLYTRRLRDQNIRQQAEMQHQRDVARDIFYQMKTLDVEIATAEQTALANDPQRGLEQVKRYESSRTALQANYDRYLQTIKINKPNDTEQHRLIVRVARIFGECEIDIPPDFEREVMSYIKRWQSTGRYARDVRTAREKGYTQTITKALLDRGLPPQFFYLAMQESDFDPYATGPATRKGYAKGMWQFIPETGTSFGLHLGPLADLPRPDPADERDQVAKSTDAATRYLDLLYSTDAQASGLLVMACYNWGEGSVLRLVRSMPRDPRQRNFWRLLAEHRDKIPQQTYDYVFMITAAAVIGENPRLFGFDFDNPLAADIVSHAESR
jgi:membrane-bound lytic murein transglycosylase D